MWPFCSVQVWVVREKLKTAQSRQKSYADLRHRALTFEIWDDFYLNVSPKKGTQRLGLKGKLAPRYIGPCPILLPKEEEWHIRWSCPLHFQISMMFLYISTKEVFSSSFRGCPSVWGSFHSIWSILSGGSHQDFGPSWKEYKKKGHKISEGLVEQSHQRWSYMGMWRWSSQFKFPSFLSDPW
jgi:hypothetical protein